MIKLTFEKIFKEMIIKNSKIEYKQENKKFIVKQKYNFEEST